MHHSFSPLKRNIILDTDSYKNDHQRMLPQNCKGIYSTVIPRKPNKYTNQVKVFGQQYLLKQYLTQKLTHEMIDEAQQEITEQGYPFNRKRWEYILNTTGGFLPLEIKAVPEGTILPVGLPIVTVKNTDEECAWLVSYVETMLHRVMWKMTTVASISLDLYQFLDKIMEKHCGMKGNVSFHLHNFGSRGADSYEADIMSGMAHLTSGFRGTDCLQANRNIKHYYNTKTPIGSSVLAAEHCNICAHSDINNRSDFEAAIKMLDILDEAIERYNIEKLGLPIVSIVGDTYDIYRFSDEYLGTKLKDRIIEQGKRGGRVVLRPDSGIPEEVSIKCIEILMNKFGFSVNKMGYKVLPEFIRVIQGDGINNDSIRKIVNELDIRKISLENIVFGMGGGLTHEASRDEFSFSMKATAMFDGNTWHDLFKDPITDHAKQSLKGLVSTFKDANGVYSAKKIGYNDLNPEYTDVMETIYLNGKITKEYTFEEIIYQN